MAALFTSSRSPCAPRSRILVHLSFVVHPRSRILVHLVHVVDRSSFTTRSSFTLVHRSSFTSFTSFTLVHGSLVRRSPSFTGSLVHCSRSRSSLTSKGSLVHPRSRDTRSRLNCVSFTLVHEILVPRSPSFIQHSCLPFAAGSVRQRTAANASQRQP